MARLLLSILPRSSSIGRRRGLLQGSQTVSHPQLGAATSTPHDGSHELPHLLPNHLGLALQPQLGAAPQGSHPQISVPHVGPRNLLNNPHFGAQSSAPQLGSAAQPVSQHELSQPHPFRPSIRSKKAFPAYVGAFTHAHRTRDPNKTFHFIESQLPKR